MAAPRRKDWTPLKPSAPLKVRTPSLYVVPVLTLQRTLEACAVALACELLELPHTFLFSPGALEDVERWLKEQPDNGTLCGHLLDHLPRRGSSAYIDNLLLRSDPSWPCENITTNPGTVRPP